VEKGGFVSTRPFGGELAVGAANHLAYSTDSGRSSLRLILQSGFRDKSFLLPDFLCGIIPRVLEESGVRFGFYRVGPNLEINAASVNAQDFDVLYVIDFFGKRAGFEGLVKGDKWVVEDCVFMHEVTQQDTHSQWIGFNSLRKSSALADGSVILSRIPLQRDLILGGEAPFAARKYQAKRLKQEFLDSGKGTEADYVSVFEQAETMVDAQSEIFSMSAESTARYLDLFAARDAERAQRRENMEILRKRLGHLEIRLDTEMPSHFVMAIAERDELRARLRAQGIFLPSHWPRTHGPDNALYRELQAVAVDGCYAPDDIARVADAIAGLAPLSSRK
jgi:hypothetical protein